MRTVFRSKLENGSVRKRFPTKRRREQRDWRNGRGETCEKQSASQQGRKEYQDVLSLFMIESPIHILTATLNTMNSVPALDSLFSDADSRNEPIAVASYEEIEKRLSALPFGTGAHLQIAKSVARDIAKHLKMKVLAIEWRRETLGPKLTPFVIIDGSRRDKNVLFKSEKLSSYKKRTSQWPQRWYNVVTEVDVDRDGDRDRLNRLTDRHPMPYQVYTSRSTTYLKHVFRCRDPRTDLEGARTAAANYASWLRASLPGSRVSSREPELGDEARSQAVAYVDRYLIAEIEASGTSTFASEPCATLSTLSRHLGRFASMTVGEIRERDEMRKRELSAESWALPHPAAKKVDSSSLFAGVKKAGPNRWKDHSDDRRSSVSSRSVAFAEPIADYREFLSTSMPITASSSLRSVAASIASLSASAPSAPIMAPTPTNTTVTTTSTTATPPIASTSTAPSASLPLASSPRPVPATASDRSTARAKTVGFAPTKAVSLSLPVKVTPAVTTTATSSTVTSLPVTAVLRVEELAAVPRSRVEELDVVPRDGVEELAAAPSDRVAELDGLISERLARMRDLAQELSDLNSERAALMRDSDRRP